MRFASTVAVSVSLSFVVACGSAADVDTAEGRVADEGALDEDSILEFLNGPDATVAVLTDDVRIQSRAARNIVAHVRGADDRLGTSDDDLLDDIAELDAILYVGPATIEAIEAYVRSHYQANDLTIEDVVLSSENAAAMVVLANGAPARLLDDDVGLDSRAVTAIVAARPIADIQALARVSYVGTTALVKLRDYVITHPTTPTVPPVAGPSILNLTASWGSGSDDCWEEGGDGVFISYQTAGATSCQLELLSLQGAVIMTRDSTASQCVDGGGAVPTQAQGYFFMMSGQEVDVRLTCVNASGASAVKVQRPGAGVSITSLSATVGDGHDETSDHTLGGAHIQFETERATSCGIELLSIADGSVIASHTADGVRTSAGFVPWGASGNQVGTSGPYFLGAWSEGEATIVDVRVTCTDANLASHDRMTRAALAPVEVECAILSSDVSSMFDGVAFTAAEECTAVGFLNFARFSEMGALTDAGRRTAYDCAPSGSCGFRSSTWSTLAEFANYSGIGATTMSGLYAAIDGWEQNGLSWDTVAQVWQNRADLVDQPIHFDNVVVTRRLPDQFSGTYGYSCIELKDTASAPNYLSACLQNINADSAPGCTGNAAACLDAFVGTTVSLRGTFRQVSGAPGGYRLTMAHAGPGAANPNAQ